LLEDYIESNNFQMALQEINFQKKNIKNKFFQNLNEIKFIILNFDNFNEKEILSIFENKNKYRFFKRTENKLISDFYMKNNEFKKANQFLKNYD